MTSSLLCFCWQINTKQFFGGVPEDGVYLPKNHQIIAADFWDVYYSRPRTNDLDHFVW